MSTKSWNRRQFVAASSAGSLAAITASAVSAPAATTRTATKLAIQGGPRVRTAGFPGWPPWDRERDEQLVLNVLRSGVWSRAKVVSEFEAKYAEASWPACCAAERVAISQA